MVSFTTSLNHAAYAHLSKRAEAEDKSVNAVIQELVEQDMKENKS